MFSLTDLIDIAKESESQISFSWSELNISKDDAYRLMALHVQDMSDDILLLKGTVVALLVENMILHLEGLKNIHEEY